MDFYIVVLLAAAVLMISLESGLRRAGKPSLTQRISYMLSASGAGVIVGVITMRHDWLDTPIVMAAIAALVVGFGLALLNHLNTHSRRSNHHKSSRL